MRFGRSAIAPFFLAVATLTAPVVAAPSSEMDRDAFNAAGQKMTDAVMANRPEAAFQQLRAIYYGGMLNFVPHGILGQVAGLLRRGPLKSQYIEFAYEIVASERFAKLKPEIQTFFASTALIRAANLRDLDAADSLLSYIDRRDYFTYLLAEREFEAIWPLVEREAGDNLTKVADREVNEAAIRLKANPGDRQRFAAMTSALHAAGRFEDVVALVGHWRAGRTNKNNLQEGDAWAMNDEARALTRLGRADEGDEVYAELAALSQSKYPWMVNFAINRAVYLAERRRWPEVLAAADRARKVSGGNNSTVYAKLLIAGARTCALHHLDRAQEAADDVKYLREKFEEIGQAGAKVAGEGLLCAGLEGEVEGRLQKLFSDKDAGVVFYDMVDGQLFEGADPSASGHDIATFILSRPTLREEVFKHIRLIPARFTPVAELRWREQVKKDQKGD